MTELKTLKDLEECSRGYPHLCKNHPKDCEKQVYSDVLRQEAMKWIKYVNECKIGECEEYNINRFIIAYIAERWIRYFFDIKEEDLK